MEYLVLRRFRTLGVQLEKGDIVDASMIRSPQLRQAEGKIVPAVSSLKVPEEFGSDDTEPAGSLGTEKEDDNTKAPAQNQETPADNEVHAPLFKLGS